MVSRIQSLNPLYEGFRSIRGDGNCYYRCVIYSIIEQAVLQNRRNVFKGLFDIFVEIEFDDVNGDSHRDMLKYLLLCSG